MEGMKGRILKKLKSIPQVPYRLKQPPLFQSHVSDDLSDPSSPLESGRILCDHHRRESVEYPEFDEDNRNLVEENKENISPNSEKKPAQSFRRPDPNSATLFDPDLLAAFQLAVMEYMGNLEEARIQEEEEEEEPPSEIPRTSSSIDEYDPLVEFEEKSPPGGRESIILYTTSLRGIRKTFEDCNSIRLLLENLKLVFVERDLSMHIEFREELWRVLGLRAIPPKLFIKGRYIGGADEVLGLHEQGRLLALVEGLPRAAPGRNTCEGCAGMRFLVCFECNGGRKVYREEQGVNVKCRQCNENGLVVCSLCCSCC